MFKNENVTMENEQIYERVDDRLYWAERKHPQEEWQGMGLRYGLWKLSVEIGEAMQALDKREGDGRVMDEVLDVMAVGIRVLRGDWR